jgi:hypothetical protein
MMQSLARQFGSAGDAINCGALNNAGSVVLVNSTGKCLSQPDTYTIQAAAAGAAGAEVLTLFLGGTLPLGTATPSVFLQQGTKLYFSEPATPLAFTVVTVTSDVTVAAVTSGTAVAVNVEPLPIGGLTTTAGAATWALIRLLGADDMPLNVQAGTESTTTLASGLHGENTTTSLMLDSSLQMILEPDDPAFWTILHNAAVTGRHFFAFVAKPGGTCGFGEAQAGNYSRTGAKQSIQKATLAIGFKKDWVLPSMYKYLVASEKLLMEKAYRLAGLAMPSAA